MKEMSKTYRVNEIFLSLQGEGYHTGRAAVFVRLSGCNLHCDFCDTDFSQYHDMTADEIAQQVEQLSTYPQTLIVLTGGEPSLQIDEALIEVLHRGGKKICIETNGTHQLPAGIDWVTCSPKEGSQVTLRHTNELKVVFTGQDVEKWPRLINANYLFLQPCSCRNTDEVVEYIIAHPQWQLSLQTHKYLNLH